MTRGMTITFVNFISFFFTDLKVIEYTFQHINKVHTMSGMSRTSDQSIITNVPLLTRVMYSIGSFIPFHMNPCCFCLLLNKLLRNVFHFNEELRAYFGWERGKDGGGGGGEGGGGNFILFRVTPSFPKGILSYNLIINNYFDRI